MFNAWAITSRGRETPLSLGSRSLLRPRLTFDFFCICPNCAIAPIVKIMQRGLRYTGGLSPLYASGAGFSPGCRRDDPDSLKPEQVRFIGQVLVTQHCNLSSLQSSDSMNCEPHIFLPPPRLRLARFPPVSLNHRHNPIHHKKKPSLPSGT